MQIGNFVKLYHVMKNVVFVALCLLSGCHGDNIQSSAIRNILVKLDNATVDENVGSVVLTVEADRPLTQDVTLQIDVAGTATEGDDYDVVPRSITLKRGTQRATLSVTVIDDTTVEAAESIDFAIRGGRGVKLTQKSASLTIVDNDIDPVFPILTIADAQATETDGVLQFSVTLSDAASTAVLVDFGTADGSATAGADYVAATGTLTFSPGETSKTIAVTVNDDDAAENAETLTVSLFGPLGALLGTATATGTIAADVGTDMPHIVIASPTVNEQDGVAQVAVSLTGTSVNSVTVDFATLDGSAVDVDDYTGQSGTVTFAPGETLQTISVTLNDDNLGEIDEAFAIDLSNAVDGILDVAHGDITISANDTPTISINDVIVTEDAGLATFVLSLSNPSTLSVTVDVTTQDGTATEVVDYTGYLGTVTFLPNSLTENLPVVVVDNLTAEGDENFVVNLSNPVNATIVDAQGTATITNDDPNPLVTFSVASLSAAETLGSVSVNIELSAMSDLTISVPYGVNAGSSATNPDDYTFDASSPTSPVSFTSGTVAQTLTINLVADGLPEGSQTVVLDLGTPTSATLGSPSTFTLTILDTDTPLTVVSADTMDADANGRIDHYKLTFSKPVNDSTFPGFVNNGFGISQVDWLVAGLHDVVLAHGSVAPEVDTVNDTILYLSFSENVLYGTGATPDITSTAAPGLVAVSGTVLQQINTADVSESDKARPMVIGATAEIGLTRLNVFFSEPVSIGANCPGGPIGAASVIYDDVSADGVGGVADGIDSDGCDARVVHQAAAGSFTFTDLFVDTVAVDPLVHDASANLIRPDAVPLTGVIHPYVLNAVSTGPLAMRITFSEPMNITQASDSTNYSYTATNCVEVPILGSGASIDNTTFEFVTPAQNNCIYKMEVTGTVTDADEDAAVVDPKFATFQGNEVLRVVGAQAKSLRTVLLTFSKDVKITGTGGADNLAYYSLPLALGTIVDATRYDAVTSNAGDRNKVLLTHSVDQGPAFYLAIVDTALRNLADTENLAGEPLDRATFAGLGGNVTSIGQGEMFSDPFADGTTFSFVFSHQNKVYVGTNDNNNAVFRFDPDGKNPVVVRFNIDSAKVGAPFSSFGNNITRPSTNVNSAGGVTRYNLAPGTDLSPFSVGVLLLAEGCANGANNHATAVATTAVNNAADYVEISATGVTSGSETCQVTLYNNAGPGDFDGVDAFVSAPVGGEQYLVFGAHNFGGGNFKELYFSSDLDTVLDTNYCDITGVTLGNTQSLQTIYGHGNYLYFGFASNNAFMPLFAHLNLSTGSCGALVDNVVATNKKIRGLDYLGGNGSPSNNAANIGVDAIVVAPDNLAVPALYLSNNGGIAATATLPPTGSTTWTPIRHDGDGVWSGTTRTIPTIGKLRAGEKGVPLMVHWGDYLFVARNRSDGGGISELWRYSLTGGLAGPPLPSDGSRWTRVVASTDSGMNGNNRALSMVVVNGDRLYLAFDNETNGAEVYRTATGITPGTFNTVADLEKIGESGLGPTGASAAILAKNKHIIANTAINYNGADYLYIAVGCLTNLTDNSACDRDSDVGQTDFAIRLFRQVD